MLTKSKSGHVVALKTMDVDDWDRMWISKSYKGKRKSVNSDLLKLNEVLFTSPKCRVLFPLCGESPDMKYVAEQGHQVVGVECSRTAIVSFFEQNELQFRTRVCERNENFEVFKSRDGRLDVTIYRGDMFDIDRSTLYGTFDVVWDKGAYVAVNPADRHRYVDIVRDLVTADTRYCLSNVTLDQSRHNTHPYSSTHEELCDVVAPYFHVDRRYLYENETFKSVFKLDHYLTTVYLLRLRSHPPHQRIDLRTGLVTVH